MYKKQLQKPDGRALHLYSRNPIKNDIVATNPPHDPIQGGSHLRWHPVRGEWVAYASHRQNRTFLPPKEYSPLAVTKSPEFPTELPAGDYDIAVFENLFPSLAPKAGEPAKDIHVPSEPGTGACEVVVFTQDPETSLANLSVDEVRLVLEVLGERTREIGSRDEIKYVLPFENRGVEVGVTLHHPHGQIYAYPFVPPVPAKMNEMEKKHFTQTEKVLLQGLIENEKRDGRRIIHEEQKALAFLPVFARYPYETWIAPVRPVSYLYELEPAELTDLARTLKTVLMKFDALWNKPFPYLMVLYQAPCDGQKHPESHAHFEIYPPYRTRDRLKFLAGTEIGGGMFVNDSIPEEKAAELKAVEVKLEVTP